MMAIIEVKTGPSIGQKLVLHRGQTVQFGRTEWADAVFPDDGRMSSVHFAVQAGEGRVVLLDTESTNGTLLNGEFIKEAVLRDGDQVVAGETHFAVSIRQEPAKPGTSTVEDLPEVGKATLKIVRDPTRLPREMSKSTISYELEHCESELLLLRGGEFGHPDQPSAPSEVAARLAYRWPQYLILDFTKAGLPIPDDLIHPEVLFDWLPKETATEHSPLILPPLPDLNVAELIDQAWDKDAVLCLYAQEDADAVISHLREATRFNLYGRQRIAGEPKSMLGYCWPGVLAQLLSFRDRQLIDNLLEGIEAVLLEVPDLPGTWQMFAQGSFPQDLESLEIRHAVARTERTSEQLTEQGKNVEAP